MRLIPLLWLILTIAFSGPVWAETYQLSMQPRYSPEEIYRRITPLAEYLGQETGHTIEVVILSDFSQYEKQLKNGSIEIGYESPYMYALVSDAHEAVASALKGKDIDRFRGVVISRKDSGLSTLADLRGKKISIAGYTSAGGYLSQKLSLMNQGINVETDMDITEATDNKQENVILAVYTGDADAGFIRESALHQTDTYISVSQIQVISRCAWLPNWTLSLSRSLPDSLKEKIASALLDLQTTHAAIKALKINHFKYAFDEDYDAIRRAAGLN
ncbi:phosphate/phosphite/phosphonate ABC transporter substrate-binding protein [Desulfospira joergensenii]|uniref:phosphate/phosphite/phosphonate ABC transporter substrate-binding protein n=1 Tax=Desulfospira joergensenii TaxID=53329 RepID=UPI00040F4388|nr:phosphate/phosphite/phosphonate ABC transporter substrate-binding protein [Desulfospira joergensenii]